MHSVGYKKGIGMDTCICTMDIGCFLFFAMPLLVLSGICSSILLDITIDKL